MSNFEYYQVKAVECAAKLLQKWSIDRLLHSANRFCTALETEGGAHECHLEAQYDDCLQDVIHIASIECGACNLYGALHLLAGNRIQSEIYFQKYIHAYNRVTKRDSELNDN